MKTLLSFILLITVLFPQDVKSKTSGTITFIGRIVNSTCDVGINMSYQTKSRQVSQKAVNVAHCQQTTTTEQLNTLLKTDEKYWPKYMKSITSEVIKYKGKQPTHIEYAIEYN